jgi:hypothetical protein
MLSPGTENVARRARALVDAELDMKLVAEASNGEEVIEKFRVHDRI